MDSGCKVKIFACPIGPEEIFGVARVNANLRGCSEGVEGICRDFVISGDQSFMGDETYFYGNKSGLAGNYTKAQMTNPRIASLFSTKFPNRNDYVKIPLSDLGISPKQVGLVNRVFGYASLVLESGIFDKRIFPKEGLRQSLRGSLLDFPSEVTEWAKQAGQILIYSGSVNLDRPNTHQNIGSKPLFI